MRNPLPALRALAHPLRGRLLAWLRTDGPATASMLARRYGESSGATSYHLRMLARYGFVEDNPGHEGGRERWWRAAHELSTTGSPARAGLVAAVEWLPMAVLGMPSRALLTRLGPRGTMIACDLARAPLVAAIPVLHWLGALDLGILLALAFLIGAFFPAHLASQRTILPALLGDVTRANAVLGAANRLPLVLGPALGGALIAVTGAANVLLLNAFTYAASALLLSASCPSRPAVCFVPEPRRATGSYGDSGGLWAGARCLPTARSCAR